MRTFALLCCVSLTGFASASYEMLFVPTTTGRVQRIDPEAGVNMGTYAAGLGAIGRVTYSPGVLKTWTVDSGTFVRGQDAWTGSLVNGGMAFSGVGAVVDDTAREKIMLIGGSSVFVLDAVTGVTTATNTSALPTGVTWRNGFVTGGTAFVFGLNASNQVVAQSFNTTTLVANSTTTFSTTGVTGFGSVALSGTLVYWVQNVGGVLSMMRSSLSGTVLGASSTAAVSITGFSAALNAAPSVLRAHSSLYVVGQASSAATTLKVLQTDINFNPQIYQSYEMTGISPNGLGTVAIAVAPEPGSLAVLALGLVALVRRQKVAVSSVWVRVWSSAPSSNSLWSLLLPEGEDWFGSCRLRWVRRE
ncbi:MAG: PEP-CTERM sorting domain-containing protein [Armatimonadetes bacterium]|nr:PEP-CTERM sorting domain-containing protein [Armatimonadota bacterium]